MGVQKTPIQKTYEISTGSDSINTDFFFGSNREFDWLEISIVFDKSDKHTTIYNSYNVELAAKYIQSIKLSNFTEMYSLTNEKKYERSNSIQEHLLYKQFVAWTCNGCSSAPLTDYTNNPVYQELIDEDSYNGVRSNERVYLDLRANAGYTSEAKKLKRNDSKINLFIQLKDSGVHKLRLRVWTYSLGQYLYVLSRQGLTLKHKTYSITQEDDDFLE